MRKLYVTPLVDKVLLTPESGLLQASASGKLPISTDAVDNPNDAWSNNRDADWNLE